MNNQIQKASEAINELVRTGQVRFKLEAEMELNAIIGGDEYGVEVKKLAADRLRDLKDGKYD